MDTNLRIAQKEDVYIIHEFIRELALFEKAPEEATITVEQLIEDGFSAKPVFEVMLAEVNNKVVGMAFYFFSYSTWKGKCIYLEDIIVKEEYRGNGIGKKLLDSVVHRGKEINAKRVQWQVLDWNVEAIEFYKKIGAKLDHSWINCKFTESQIKNY
jgi:GNAT superfamily N-acetyltransferase